MRAFVTFSCIGALAGASAFAADSENIEEVVVTGSLIPLPAQSATARAVTTITSADLQQRGFSNIADALQQGSFATGSIQNGAFSGGFTPGAKVLSLFGLSPGYTKVLIDGLPVADYPALYNGSDVVTSISGIPMDLVERLDVLPGGSSSIYGSDAIAGVINIIMKKELDGPYVDVRYGFTADGGGNSRRISAGDGFSVGGFKFVGGAEYEETDPIWGYQRPLTNKFFDTGTSPPTAERDTLVDGLFGTATGNYYFDADGITGTADCANLASQFHGTEKLQFRAGHGYYCGTTSQGFYTDNNGDSNSQAYLRMTNDLTDNVQLYANVLWNHDVSSFSNGTYFYETNLSPEWSYYEDPNVTGTSADPNGPSDLLNLQKIFSPEEAGSLANTLSFATTNAVRANGGVKGNFGTSKWTYDAGFLFSKQRLVQADHQLTAAGLDSYFGSFLTNETFDPINGTNIFNADYSKFYTPVTPATYASFSTHSYAYSYTEDSSARGQLTNSDLFTLPGGPAGVAFVIEGGNQGWRLTPDPGINAGEFFGPSEQSPSDGHRSRLAGTAEIRMPVLSMLTLDASGRYDRYSAAGDTLSKPTYDISVEFRPFAQLLGRAHYGTSFKAPSLADQFQGPSGAFGGGADYLACFNQFNITPANIGTCRYSDQSIQTTTAGNPGLKPITAKVFGYGLVWSPSSNLSLNADYFHWAISNEVAQQSLDLILLEDYQCNAGILSPTSGTCQAVESQITRDAGGLATVVSTPKVNVAVENINAIVAGFNYRFDAGAAGKFELEASWSDLIQHKYRLYPTDPLDNLLEDPINSQEFKSKINSSVSWSKGDFGATLYANRYGASPNFLAVQNGYGAPGAKRLAAWTLLNLSAHYQILKQLDLSAYVDNLLNKMPPTDNSYPGTAGDNGGIANSPTGAAYNIFNYNNYGRSYFVEAEYHFKAQ